MRRATQLSLFDDDHAAASLASLLPLVRSAMSSVAGGSSLSRDQIADRLTEVARAAGISISRGNAKSVKTATLEKWLSPAAREHPPSLTALVAFCLVTRDVRPLEPILATLGCSIMTKEDRKLRDYGAAILAEREAKKKKRQLEAEL
ncbi:MAG: hypothetical protein ACNI3A_18585 [Desulfovibrio sp.]|uniref:hypothetical protein n=1 Tax=Desulfovibrio sp. 7SRBS1 TaxID=3378064 RepID=UPI003B3C6B36